jgi:hypothetical protein
MRGNRLLESHVPLVLPGADHVNEPHLIVIELEKYPVQAEDDAIKLGIESVVGFAPPGLA